VGAKASQHVGLLENHPENFRQVANVKTPQISETARAKTADQLIKEYHDVFEGDLGVVKAVKSRARCTTLEAARASETKFTLYFFPFLREFFTTFLFKLSYVQLWYSLALRVLVLIVGSFLERVFSHLRLFHTYLFRLYATCVSRSF